MPHANQAGTFEQQPLDPMNQYHPCRKPGVPVIVRKRWHAAPLSVW